MFMYDYKLDFTPEEVLVYLRKSRSDDPLLSVEEVLQRHETILDEWSERNLNAIIPEENKYREVVSGETIDDRPKVQTVLKRIESPKIRAILVVEVQRLSRGDLEDAGRLMKLLRYTNTVVITPPKTYDLNNEYDRDIFERELKRGNEFLEYQKKIMNRGRLLSVSQGNYIGSHPPYGYDKIWITEGRRKCPTLGINEDEANIVRMVFDMYVNQDMGVTTIAHRLDSLGSKPRIGKNWSPSQLKDMLANIHYIGKVWWNRRKAVLVVEDGEIRKTEPRAKEGDYLIAEGKHEAIISEDLFNAAQEKRGRNHRAKPSTKVRNPLAGLIYCQCGRAMSLRTYKKNGIERSSPRLLCDNQTNCKTSSCLYEEMLEHVRSILQQNIEDFEIIIKNNDKESRKLHDNLIRNLENKLDELNRKEISQWEKYSEEGMPKEIFDKLNEKVLNEKAETIQALSTAKSSMPDITEYEEDLLRFRDAYEALDNPDFSAAQKNKLLKSCIERIEYHRDKVERVRRAPGEKKGTSLPVGSKWTTTPIKLTVNLKTKSKA